MAFKKGQGGRPKGAKNKTTGAAKEAIGIAADKLGGSQRLVEWAQSDPKNEYAFWTLIWPKLVPHEVTGGEGAPLIPPGSVFQIALQQIPGAENQT